MATAQEVRTVLSKAGARVQREPIVSALDRLSERGILERLGALSYRFRVALLRDWLCQRLDLQEVVRNTRWDAVAPARGDGGQRVRKLSTARRSRRGQATRSERASAEAAGEEQEGSRASGWRWLWAGAVVVLGLVLLLVMGPRLFQPSSRETPVAVLSSSTTAPMVTVTRLAALATPTQPRVVPSATHTPLPLPTETPSPTAPVIVARSIPSIAYQSRGSGEAQWSIYVMNSDGSDRSRLAEAQSGFLSAPSWSPDGSKLAFVSERDGSPDIWVMTSDGSDPVDLTQDEAKDHSPAWSPDGEWIAFASVRDSLYWELYLMRPDGSDVQRLTWWEDASDLSPTWSPDGTRIAFASKRDGNWEIYMMDRDGGNLVRLTDHEADDTNPAWSPDGGRIAFASTRDGYPEIYVMAIAGGDAVNVSNAPFSSEHGPTWSPDGGRIAFYSDRDGEWDIYIMASDGSDVVKLTGDNSNDQVPAWRP